MLHFDRFFVCILGRVTTSDVVGLKVEVELNRGVVGAPHSAEEQDLA